jgi:hypothetical protein
MGSSTLAQGTEDNREVDRAAAGRIGLARGGADADDVRVLQGDVELVGPDVGCLWIALGIDGPRDGDADVQDRRVGIQHVVRGHVMGAVAPAAARQAEHVGHVGREIECRLHRGVHRLAVSRGQVERAVAHVRVRQYHFRDRECLFGHRRSPIAEGESVVARGKVTEVVRMHLAHHYLGNNLRHQIEHPGIRG